MDKIELISEYENRLKEHVFTSNDGELQLRYESVIQCFKTLLDDLFYQEYLHQERRYDFWGEEITHNG